MTHSVYRVVAKRWKHGWELHVDGVGVTQSRTLVDAEPMARDYISLVLDLPDDAFGIEMVPEIGAGADGELITLDQADREAEGAQERAVTQRRKVARQLDSLGLSGREIAIVLKVSPQRVSQLLDRKRRRASSSHVAGKSPA
ncbi:hypothetical protein [Streptomyces alkaliphilus]|uniref:hypothetical protein n=1 Tax=Streptomyces alkaliphilus TaxID=1472722 RepID=UPI00117C1448|nr:hypothetical protein [Streptomyces alkaliphilus]MQS09334.1 hypothetical protein [Streptomyces alkaliphilus]